MMVLISALPTCKRSWFDDVTVREIHIETFCDYLQTEDYQLLLYTNHVKTPFFPP